MPVVGCPIDCDYETPDVDPVIAAVLITTHVTIIKSTSSKITMARTEKISNTSNLNGVTMEATELTGSGEIIQLLECCDDQLRRDLTRSLVEHSLRKQRKKLSQP